MTWDLAGVNNDAMWAAGTANHLIVKTAGVYIAWSQVHLAAGGGSLRGAHILLNGTAIGNTVGVGTRDPLNFGDGNQFVAETPPMSLAVNATVYLSVFQNSGGALNLDNAVSGAYLCLLRLGQ